MIISYINLIKTKNPICQLGPIGFLYFIEKKYYIPFNSATNSVNAAFASPNNIDVLVL
jgi:hypothetical protein